LHPASRSTVPQCGTRDTQVLTCLHADETSTATYALGFLASEELRWDDVMRLPIIITYYLFVVARKVPSIDDVERNRVALALGAP